MVGSEWKRKLHVGERSKLVFHKRTTLRGEREKRERKTIEGREERTKEEKGWHEKMWRRESERTGREKKRDR